MHVSRNDGLSTKHDSLHNLKTCNWVESQLSTTKWCMATCGPERAFMKDICFPVTISCSNAAALPRVSILGLRVYGPLLVFLFQPLLADPQDRCMFPERLSYISPHLFV